MTYPKRDAGCDIYKQTLKHKIKPIYSALKEEIFGSVFMNIKVWNIHLHKANQYMLSAKVKKLRKQSRYLSVTIEHKHILCIILYCDTNDLQSHFSATFRKQHQHETIDQLKKRHQKYYHFARGIIEAIDVGGINGFVKEGRGPFYCGLNRILNVQGQCTMLFAAPLSTSKAIEVAIQFCYASWVNNGDSK